MILRARGILRDRLEVWMLASAGAFSSLVALFNIIAFHFIPWYFYVGECGVLATVFLANGVFYLYPIIYAIFWVGFSLLMVMVRRRWFRSDESADVFLLVGSIPLSIAINDGLHFSFVILNAEFSLFLTVLSFIVAIVLVGLAWRKKGDIVSK
jgi:hypothetical protein